MGNIINPTMFLKFFVEIYLPQKKFYQQNQ